MSHNIETVVDNKFQMGEGPYWDAPNMRLLMVDIYEGAVYRWKYQSLQLEDALKPGDPYVGAVVPRHSGGLVVAGYHRYASLDETTGESETIAQVFQESDQVRFNDGKCDCAGRFWAGSMALDEQPGQGALFSLNTDQSVDTKISNVGIANGLAWSSDNTIMYFIDSLKYNLTAYKFDALTGAISDPRIITEFDETFDGMPDGQTIDADGNLWVAMFGGGRIIKVDTTTGKHAQRLHISGTALKTTSCCFGGPNLDELFVTSGLNTDEDAAPIGQSGSLFKVTGLGVKGVLPEPYQG